ncbi:type II toxin-antitoxin system PemK/MazF family toxin [Priestia aryabhattai]|nr:type II toxin-antitoxin system PemK/MazF family toxin [Priestia aryabhattai]
MLRYSDIKVGHVYFADLRQVRQYEFGGNHLSIVLNKCADRRSVIIVSLTSERSGVGQNKIDLGILPSLPQRLVTNQNGNPVKSYVVLDQVRTVVASRVQEVVDGKDSNGNDIVVDCPVPSNIFSDIVKELADRRIADLNDEDAIAGYHKNAYLQYCVNKIVNLTYDVIKERGNLATKQAEIISFHKIAATLEQGFLIDKYLTQKDVINGISLRVSEIVTPPIN